MAQSLIELEKNTISLLKSCIASSLGNITVEQLNNDYQNLAGEWVPLKKLNHSSLLNFLLAFPNDFKITQSYGKTFVSSIIAEAKHIVKFVQAQKTNPKSRKRPPTKKYQEMRRPRSSYFNQIKSHQASSSFGNKKHFSAPPNRRLNSYPQKPLLPLPSVVPRQEPRSLLRMEIANNVFSSKTRYLKVSPENKRIFTQTSEPTFNPQLERQEPIEDETLFYNPLLEGNGYRRKSKSPVQNSSSIKNSASFKLSINTQKNKNVNQCSFMEKLKEMSIRHGLDVIYTPIPCGQKKAAFICKLRVGNEDFSSYPEQSPTAEEIKEYVAEKAYKKLKESLKDMSPPLTLPETSDLNVISCRLIEILCNESEGLWWDSLRNKYKKQYYESLSEDCIHTIFDNFSDQISVLKIPGKNPNWILSLKKNVITLTTNGFNIQEEPIVENVTICEIPSLTLPEDGMWMIFVTYIKNCNEIWFRIIGEQYSDAFENLVTDMELYYMEESNLHPVSAPNVENYYACNYDESWFRVKFLQIQGGDAEILFVDAGDTEVVNLSSLYLLDPQFLSLPCQNVRCVLEGLEDCSFEDQAVLSALQNLALGKALVAEVFSRDDDLSVILYDTSTDEDININEQLMQLMPESYPEPKLPPDGGICEVYISHVSADGEIYVRLETATYKILETLLATARQHTAEILGDDNIEIDITKLYLAKFSADGEWHRAAPRTVNKNINDEVILKAIDKGFCGRVASHMIIPLKNLSKILCKIPAQALPCKLHNFPTSSDLKWTRQATDELLRIAADGPLLLKVILEATESELAQVQLFKRHQPENYLISINDSLAEKRTLFSDEDNNNNCCSDSLPDCNDNMNALLPSSSYCNDGTLDRQELECARIPLLNELYDIYVTYAASPSNFAVQSLKTKSKLEMLMGEMYSYYSQESNRKPVKQIYEWGYYALLHTDESWYRVHVIQVCSDQVSGLFVDYGDFFCASSDAFQSLCPNFRILPRQSFKATLGGIAPVGKDWTPIDAIRFGSLVQEKNFVSRVIGIEYPEEDSHLPNCKNEPPTLVLKLIDTTKNVDLHIDQVLVDEKRATFV